MKRLVALMLTLLVNAATAAPSVTTSTAPGSLVSASGVKDSAKNVLTPDCQKAHGDLDAAQAKKQQADADIQKAKTELSGAVPGHDRPASWRGGAKGRA